MFLYLILVLRAFEILFIHKIWPKHAAKIAAVRILVRLPITAGPATTQVGFQHVLKKMKIDTMLDPVHCDVKGWPSCYCVGQQDGTNRPHTEYPSGDSANYCAGWNAGSLQETPQQQAKPPSTMSPFCNRHSSSSTSGSGSTSDNNSDSSSDNGWNQNQTQSNTCRLINSYNCTPRTRLGTRQG
jgi:hypothetical protein